MTAVGWSKYPNFLRARLAAGGLVGWLCLSGCAAGYAPVARPPWLEHRDIALNRERLHLAVTRSAIHVTADFAFLTAPDAEIDVMSFPVGGGCGATDQMELTWWHAGQQRRMAAARGEPGALPVHDACDYFDLLPPSGWSRDRAPGLRVQYSAPRQGDFVYILRSGAYWSGPIRRLHVVVDDPEQLVRTASAAGESPHARSEHALSWHFVDLEPAQDVRLAFDD